MLLSLLFLLPTLAIAFPSPLLARQSPSPCAPTTYRISSFTLTPSTLHFTFQSFFPTPSLVTDPASLEPATCSATASNTTGTFPSEFTCSTGRTNLIIDVRGEKPGREYQVGHWWRCNG